MRTIISTAIRAILLAIVIAASGLAHEASAADAAAESDDANAPQRVNVDSIKERYWARGNESELGVVQNRLYSKEKKIQFGLLGGIVASDPFLNAKVAGATLGWHFNEYLSLHLIGWKAFVSPSSALETFQQTIGATTNNNPQKWFLGTEVMGSILYGKLSLVGKKIIYYDMHLMAGMGSMTTDNGSFFAGHLGLGQQFYVNQTVSISVDYRLQGYNETLVEKVITPRLGQTLGTRMNWSNTITLGINFLFGPGAKGGAK